MIRLVWCVVTLDLVLMLMKVWKVYCLVIFFSKEYCCEYKEDMDRQDHDAVDEESPTYDMDESDDYWNFIDNPNCENIMENPIRDMSNKLGSVYSKICGSPIYDMLIEGIMDLDAWENFSMEEEHSGF